MTDSMEIIYTGDPLCGWCYGFSEIFETIKSRYSNRIRFSYLMGGLKVNHSVTIDSTTKPLVYDNWKSITKHTGSGISVDMISELPEGRYNSEPPCRAVVSVGMLDNSLMYSYYTAVHHAFYREMKNITDTECLCRLASEFGIKENTFMTVFNSDAARMETKKGFSLTKELGVLAFPALVLKNGTTTTVLNQGYKPLDMIDSGIRGWLNGNTPMPGCFLN